MKKVLLLSHIFPPAIDGGSRVIYKIGEQLKTNKHQVVYLSSNCYSTDDFVKNKFKKISFEPKSKNIIYVPVYHHLRRFFKFISLFLVKNSYVYGLLKICQKGPVFKLVPFIKATIKILKFKPDLIIAGPLPTTIILYTVFFKKINYLINRQSTKILINSSFHQTDQDFHQKPLIKVLQQSDYLWTLTKYESNFFIKNLNINPQKIILAGNGIDPELLIKKTKNKNSKSNKFKILFIGSISAHKGLKILIDSFAEIYQINPKISLTISGQKTLYFPEINKIIKNQPKKIQKQIKFVFDFPQNILLKLIDQCDLLVLPSEQESFGLVLIESWARSKPVITSDIPPLKELINKTHGGLTFTNKDNHDLTRVLISLIKSPKERQQLGKNGLNYVKNNYTWPIVFQKIFQKIVL